MMLPKFVQLTAFLAAFATEIQSLSVRRESAGSHNNTLSVRAVNSPYSSSSYSTSCSLPNFILAPQPGSYSTKLTQYLSNDYVTVPCKQKYFYMTFNAEYLTSNGFTIMMNPTLPNGQWPALNVQYTKAEVLNSISAYASQDPLFSQGRPVETVASCGNSNGKGITYFLAYDQTGIHMGQNGIVYGEIDTAEVPASFLISKMYIQAGSDYNPSVAITNINIKCLAGDSCSVAQDDTPSTTEEDVACILNPASSPTTATPAPKTTSTTSPAPNASTVTVTKTETSTTTKNAVSTTTATVTQAATVTKSIVSTSTVSAPTTLTTTIVSTITAGGSYTAPKTVTRVSTIIRTKTVNKAQTVTKTKTVKKTITAPCNTSTNY